MNILFCQEAHKKSAFGHTKNKAMGASQSQTTCVLPASNTSKTEFDIALDAAAFEYHVLSASKSFRLTRLDVNGTWHETEEDVYTKSYEDPYIKITPEGSKARVTVKKNVEFLLKSSKVKPKTILCAKGPASILYVYLKLKKASLTRGTFTIGDPGERNFFFLVDNRYILMVTLPDDGTTVRSTMKDITDRGIGVVELAFGSRLPFQDQHHMPS